MTEDFLQPPVSDRDHRQGPARAVVTLVEYGDYACPSCAAAAPIVKQIKMRMGDRLCLVFRNFPLALMHPHAQHAAEAAEAAADQQGFWPMHDLLFSKRDALSDDNLHAYVRTLGLDAEQFTTELREHRYAARVREDVLSGMRSGVKSTPTFFINGVRYESAATYGDLLVALERTAYQLVYAQR